MLLFSLSLVSAKVTYKEFDIVNGDDNTNEMAGAVVEDEGFKSGSLVLPRHSGEPQWSREQR